MPLTPSRGSLFLPYSTFRQVIRNFGTIPSEHEGDDHVPVPYIEVQFRHTSKLVVVELDPSCGISNTIDFGPTNFFHHSRLSEDMNKKPGIVKALICDLGLKTLKLPSKDRSSTAGREENGPCAATPYKTPGEDLANGALSDVGTGMQTESESEAEYDVPVGSDAEGEKDCARWKMDIKFLLNEEDVEPEHSGGAGGLQGGGETIPHCTDDNGTVLIWWEGATKAKNKQKEGASSAKNRGSNGVGKDDDIETQSSLSVSSSQWNFWDDGADRTT